MSAADVWQTTAVRIAGLAPGGRASAAVESRAEVLRMTETAERAVLAPVDPGRWPHDLRAALAARVARLNRDEALAAQYAERVGDPEAAALAEPGADSGDAALGAVLRFMDAVALRPREVTAADIEALQAAGIGAADIVRLAELNAFLAYQIRLVHGLRLMAAE